jgi:hypothetical protein
MQAEGLDQHTQYPQKGNGDRNPEHPQGERSLAGIPGIYRLSEK